MKKFLLILTSICTLCALSACGSGATGGTSGGGGGGGGSHTATHFSVTAPANAAAGTAVNFTVTALDASNNVVSTYSGTVHFTSTDSHALLPPNSILTNGTGSFSAALKTAGNQTIVATDASTPSIFGASKFINVTNDQNSLSITSGQPPDGVVGQPYGPFQLLGHCSIVQKCPLYFFKITAGGGTGSYSWTMSAAPGSSIPNGISCCTLTVEHVFPGPIGTSSYFPVIYGTPTAAGSYQVTVTVTDAGTKAQASATYTIVIAGGSAIAAEMAAVQSSVQHHHYKLIDLGTFGGAASYINEGGAEGVFSNAIGDDQGAFTGWADTSTADPSPGWCFNGDCRVSHAFQWQNGAKKDLGALLGGASSATTWMSANGLIAGTSQNGRIDPSLAGGPFSGFPEERAVLWVHGKIVDLGTLPEGGYESGASAVNNSGQVTGWAINTIPEPFAYAQTSAVFFPYEAPDPDQMRAFFWQDGVMRDLGTLGGPDAFPVGINELGQVIGISFTSYTANSANGCNPGLLPNIPTQDPFFWDKDSGMIDLGSFGGTCGNAFGLNNNGQVVGQSNLFGDQATHAFLWDRATGLTDLGTLGGDYSSAFAINGYGTVVGASYLPGDTQLNAVLWGKNGMVDLGALTGDNCAFPFWINASDQVVGHGGTNCQGRGFLSENSGPVVDLNTLVVSSNGFSITDATYINDRGEVIGRGLPVGCSDGDTCGHVYVLIPCDDNHPRIEGCDYSLLDATAAEANPAQESTPSALTSGETKSTPAELMMRLRFMAYRDRRFEVIHPK